MCVCGEGSLFNSFSIQILRLEPLQAAGLAAVVLVVLWVVVVRAGCSPPSLPSLSRESSRGDPARAAPSPR